MFHTRCGSRLCTSFCKMCFESSTGRWAVLQLLCCPSKQTELSENILQNLFHNLPPQSVSFFYQSSEEYLENFSTMKSYALEDDYIMQLRRSSVHEITLGFGTMLSRLCNEMRCVLALLRLWPDKPPGAIYFNLGLPSASLGSPTRLALRQCSGQAKSAIDGARA